MHGRHHPFAIRSKARVVEMVQVRAVEMGFDFACIQVVKTHALRVVIDDVELWILLRKKTNHLAVRTPERFARVVHELLSISAVNVHHIQAADGFPAFPLVRHETNLRAVGRHLRVMLLFFRRLGQVDRIRPVSVHDEDFPIVVDVGFVGDLERQLAQSFPERSLCLSRRERNREQGGGQERA